MHKLQTISNFILPCFQGTYGYLSSHPLVISTIATTAIVGIAIILYRQKDGFWESKLYKSVSSIATPTLSKVSALFSNTAASNNSSIPNLSEGEPAHQEPLSQQDSTESVQENPNAYIVSEEL